MDERFLKPNMEHIEKHNYYGQIFRKMHPGSGWRGADDRSLILALATFALKKDNQNLLNQFQVRPFFSSEMRVIEKALNEKDNILFRELLSQGNEGQEDNELKGRGVFVTTVSGNIGKSDVECISVTTNERSKLQVDPITVCAVVDGGQEENR